MQLSLYSSVSFKHPFGLSHAISIARSLGYDAVDVRGYSLDVPILEDRHINAVGYDMIGPGTLDSHGEKDLQDLLKESHLFLSGISCYNSLTVPEGNLAHLSMQKFKEMIDFASELSIPWVRLIGYSEFPFQGISLDRKTAKELLAKRIRELCQYGADRHVGILLENGENIIPNCTSEMLEIAQRVDHDNLSLVFDVLNTVFEGLDPYKELKRMQGKIGCLHVKNAHIQAPSQDDYTPKNDNGFAWTLLTAGTVDYTLVMDEAISQGFDSLIVCEYANPYKGMSRSYWEGLPDPYTWAKDARDFLLPYIRKGRTA